MDDVEETVRAELMVIEGVYELRILNRDEVAGLIASAVENNAQALKVCTAINTWVLINKKGEGVTIPDDVLMGFIRKIVAR
jgi:hypothetical protein